jgi:hypothetical protein
MNIKTTIALLVLAGGCVALFWKGPELAPRLGLAPQPEEVKEGPGDILAGFPADRITRVEIEAPGRPKLALESPAPGKPLELPGRWPIRRSEVDDLLAKLHGLKSRYYPIAAKSDADLKQYGLTDDQEPIVVRVTAGEDTRTLKFGEAPPKPGENPFTRATYVKADGADEILRLGPDVMPVLRRTEETYRRRQLFPEALRARVAEGKRPPRFPGMEDTAPVTAPTTFLLAEAAEKIEVESPAGGYTLQRESPLPPPEVVPVERPDPLKAGAAKKDAPADPLEGEPAIQPAKLAHSWVMTGPIRDRADPEKLRAILTTIPNLWLERFVDSPQAPDYFYGLGPTPGLAPQLFTLLGGAIPTGVGQSPLAPVLNVASLPEAKGQSARLTVTFEGGARRTLQIGRVARTVGADELRYARIEEYPLVFELRADKLGDLLVNLGKPSLGGPSPPFEELRDPRLVRFEEAHVAGVEIVSHAGKNERRIALKKEGEEWKILRPVQETADRTEVTELLKLLKDMEARRGDIIDPGYGKAPRLAALGAPGAIDPVKFLGLVPDRAKTITLTFDEKSGLPRAAGKKDGPPQITFVIGRRNGEAGKRDVMVEGWSRINVVDDRGGADKVSRLDRQPSAFRTLKLFDPVKSKVGEIAVQRPATPTRPADSYSLKEEGTPPEWTIAAPFKAGADRALTGQLAAQVGGLGTQRYVYDPKTDDPLASADQWPRYLIGLGALAAAADPTGDAFFGLEKPTLTLTLKFTEPKGAADVVIEVGRARSPAEYYARLKGTTGLFTVPDALVKDADRRPEDLVDRTLIQFAGKPEVQAIRRQMAGQELELTQNNSALWEITKPAAAKADQTTAEDLANDLLRLRATKIEAVNPKDLKPFGLDPPAATITVEALDKSKLVEKVLLVGAPADPKQPEGDRFVKAQGSTMVAVIPARLAAKLVAPPLKFRDLSLGSGFVTADRIVLERGDRKVTFAKGTGGWRVKEPLDAEAEDEALRELHDTLARPRAEELVEEKAKDLAKYGLDKPTHWIVYSGDKEVFHLLVGNREKIGPPEKQTEGYRAYAKLAKGDGVYLLDMPLTTRLAAEYRKRRLWEPFTETEITEFSVKAPDAKDSYTLTKTPKGWEDPAKPGERLDKELVDNLLFTVANLKVDRFFVDKGVTDLKPYGLDKPRTLTVTTEGGKKHTLLLGGVFEGKKLYAKLDDPARTDVFLLSENDTRVLNRPRAEYAAKAKDEPKRDEKKK